MFSSSKEGSGQGNWHLKRVTNTAAWVSHSSKHNEQQSIPGDTEVLWAGTTGWNMNTSIRFQITHLPAQGIIRLKLHEGATLLYDEEIVDNGVESLRGGRLGVYCASQDSVLWSALRYR